MAKKKKSPVKAGGKSGGKSGGRPAKRGGAGSGDGTALAIIPGRIFRWSLLLVLPLALASTFCLVRFDGWRPALRHAFHQGDLLNLSRVLGGGELIILALTVILPLAHWVRLYPMARFSTSSKVVWYLPMLLSTPVWVGLYGAVLAGIGLGLWSNVMGFDGLALLERVRPA